MFIDVRKGEDYWQELKGQRMMGESHLSVAIMHVFVCWSELFIRQ